MATAKDRAGLPSDLFGKKKVPETVIPQSGNTVLQQESNEVKPQESNTAKPQKVTFYLEDELLDLLDDLSREYKKRTGRRINRQDVARKVLNKGTIEMLLDE